MRSLSAINARRRSSSRGWERCSGPERQALPDHPALADAAIAGFDRRLRRRGGVADVEALAAFGIDDLTVNKIPLLCARPVAIVQLDDRSIRRSSS